MFATLSRLLSQHFPRLFSSPANLPATVWATAEAGLPFLGHLTPEERTLLRQRALDFILAKTWDGTHGLVVTLEMQVTIALQACLLILKRDPHDYDGWQQIILYPGDFIVPREVMDDAGVVHAYDDTVLGEAWEHGPVLLSWLHAENGVEEGLNVVIHEFAHKLDMANGEANGQPPMTEAAAARWQAAFVPAYADFCARLDRGEDTAIDPYAAESPAEFFAVLSEVFFETPALLHRTYPAVFAVLAAYYRQTPAAL